MTIKDVQLNKTWCDWSKLIAAILVAISHYATCVCINNDWSDSSFLRLWCQGGNLGVALFFFLSGYGLMESEKQQHLVFNAFVKRRFAKVYLPALMVSVAWVLICLCFRTHYSPSSLWEALYDILWGFNDSVLWFVKILFGLYGVFYLFSLLRYKGYNGSPIAVLILGTLLTLFVAREVGFPYINVPLFTIGVLASLYKEKRFFTIPSAYLFIILLGIINLVAFLVTKESHVAHGVINCAFVCIVLIIIEILPPPPSGAYYQKLLSQFIMPGTYMLYLVHHKVLTFMVWNWGYVSLLLWAITTIAVTIIFTYLSKLLKI